MRRLLKPLLLSCLMLSPDLSDAADVTKPAAVTLTLLSSAGIIGAIQAVAPEYEKLTGVMVKVQPAASLGQSPQAIPQRLDRGEPADIVLMVGSGLDRLVAQGQVDKDTRVDLGKAFIAMAVREGAPKPYIGTLAAFRQTLIDADSVAYSDGISGAYLSHWLFVSMKLAPRFLARSRMISTEPVAAAVARGETGLGLEQLSQLKLVSGIDIVGLIPDSVQQMTLYAGAVVKGSTHPAQAKALLDYLGSEKARDAIERSGLAAVH